MPDTLDEMGSRLPLLTDDLPGTGGALRATEEDFCVEELPAYEPSGTGDHVFAWVQKRGTDTNGAIRALARALEIRPADVGAAGLKDRRAVTRQYLSFPPPVSPEALLELRIPGVEILAARRHPHKLKTGHLRGNRFALRVSGLSGSAGAAAERARRIVARLAEPPGVPNYFGVQRFGRDGRNAELGAALVRGERLSRPPRGRQRRFFVSAFQSLLFNEFLRRRLNDRLFSRVLEGDALMKTDTGGRFISEEVAADQARLERGEVVPTGPMFGHKMMAPPEGTEAAARERSLLAELDLSPASFKPLGKIATGTRRALAVALGDPSVTPVDGDSIEICFSLPAGAYATTVMREVMKDNEPSPGESS